jgi:hypothetical protein
MMLLPCQIRVGRKYVQLLTFLYSTNDSGALVRREKEKETMERKMGKD